jgi:hypothetical protein
MNSPLESSDLLKSQKKLTETRLLQINGNITQLQNELERLEQAQTKWILRDDQYSDFLNPNAPTRIIPQLYSESEWLDSYKTHIDIELDNQDKCLCTDRFDEQTEYLKTQITLKENELIIQQSNLLSAQTSLISLNERIKATETNPF